MKKAFKITSVIIILLTLLSLYSFMVRHVVLKGERLGIFTEPLRHFSLFPQTVYDVLHSNEIKGIPPSYVKEDTTFNEINRLDYDLYGINSFYDADENTWDIRLFNFKDDSVIYEWHLSADDYHKSGERKFENARPMDCLMLPDYSVIVLLGESHNLYKLDRNSNIIWHNKEKNFHHTVNLSNDGNLWACTSGRRVFKLAKRGSPGYIREDYITKIDNRTGEILYNKSVADILIENGYKNFVYGFTNDALPKSRIDPIHLNDIQPVLKDGKFWKKKDLFLSLRHKSLVIHYRPGSNKIVRLIRGPFLFQHDVDIISDSEIAIFNNNTTTVGDFEMNTDTLNENNVEEELLNSNIIVYDYRDSSFRKPLEHHFINENIYTRTEGVYNFISTGDTYIESQNESKVYIVNDEEVLLRKQFDSPIEGYVYMPNWIRIYENIPDYN